jgi:hypothetical protein
MRDYRAYGVLLLDESDKTISIPLFLTAARTDLKDPISTPIQQYKNKEEQQLTNGGTSVHA